MPDIDWTKPVRRIENKEPFRVLCTDAPGRYPVIGLYEDGSTCTFTINGRDVACCQIAVENAPERVSLGWVNIYNARYLPAGLGGRVFAARTEADLFAEEPILGRPRISVIEIYRDEDGILRIEEHEVSK